jgi:plastocyanin
LRLRTGLILGIVALLGAATVVLPGIASSETPPTPPTINAVSYKYLGEEKELHYWSPASAKVGEGGTVTFTNPYAEHRHGLKFTGGPATPNCNGLTAEMGEETGALKWQAECSFSAPGTYTFVCTVHPKEMTGTVVVAAAAGGTTTTTTTTTTPTGTTTVPGSPLPGATTQTQLLAGAASSAVRVASSQHGHAVHGSLALSQAATGGTLIVELLAPRASLASSGGAKPVQVGKLTRSSLHPGQLSFTVPLSTRARRALHRHGHLALRLRIRLSSGASTVTELRSVTLHA